MPPRERDRPTRHGPRKAANPQLAAPIFHRQRQRGQQRHARASTDHLDERSEARRAEPLLADAVLRTKAQRLIAEAVSIVE